MLVTIFSVMQIVLNAPLALFYLQVVFRQFLGGDQARYPGRSGKVAQDNPVVSKGPRLVSSVLVRLPFAAVMPFRQQAPKQLIGHSGRIMIISHRPPNAIGLAD